MTLLRRVPEDGDAMESHSAPSPQSSSQCLNDQEGGGRDSLSRTPVFGSTFQNVEGLSLTMGDDNEEEEEQRWLDEEIARQGLYWGMPLFSSPFVNNSDLSFKQDLTVNLLACTV